MKTDILIVGSGCSGLYTALNLPQDYQITIITKGQLEESDSFLAQGGICMLKDPSDYTDFFEDTLRAGHYKNDRLSVELMIKTSPEIIQDLLSYGVDFQREADGEFAYTREGAHSQSRILFHQDKTGEAITSRLLAAVKKRSNITLLEQTYLLDILTDANQCYGGLVRLANQDIAKIMARVTILASGGVGGLYKHSTNVKLLTGDALTIAMRHGIELKDMSYVQIHPTTLYQKDSAERSFLISESVRGEGALLYDKHGERFVDELQPRDVVTQAIFEQMAKDDTDFVWEDLRPIPKEILQEHFPTILSQCQQAGYDPFQECIPVVPAQHYFMGGIRVNHWSHTSMTALYAVGETACNGVHGQNRLASNSLLESLVFAKRAAQDMVKRYDSLSIDTVAIESIDLPKGEPMEQRLIEELTKDNPMAHYIL